MSEPSAILPQIPLMRRLKAVMEVLPVTRPQLIEADFLAANF
jgi:hypothetical protein